MEFFGALRELMLKCLLCDVLLMLQKYSHENNVPLKTL